MLNALVGLGEQNPYAGWLGEGVLQYQALIG